MDMRHILLIILQYAQFAPILVAAALEAYLIVPVVMQILHYFFKIIDV
jgi:hypothetical protein